MGKSLICLIQSLKPSHIQGLDRRLFKCFWQSLMLNVNSLNCDWPKKTNPNCLVHLSHMGMQISVGTEYVQKSLYGSSPVKSFCFGMEAEGVMGRVLEQEESFG